MTFRREEPTMTGSEAASLYASLAAEMHAARKITPELVARLAISLAGDLGENTDQSISFLERTSAAGIRMVDMEDMNHLLSDSEFACVPKAQGMLDVFAKGDRS